MLFLDIASHISNMCFHLVSAKVTGEIRDQEITITSYEREKELHTWSKIPFTFFKCFIKKLTRSKNQDEKMWYF